MFTSTIHPSSSPDTMLPVFDRLLRETVLNIACRMGDNVALNEASRIFDQWVEGSLRYDHIDRMLTFKVYTQCKRYFKTN